MPSPADLTAPAAPVLTPYGRRAFLAEASGLAIAAGLSACGGSGATDPPVGPQTVFSFAKNDKLSTVGGSIVTEVISQGRNVLLIIARTGQTAPDKAFNETFWQLLVKAMPPN